MYGNLRRLVNLVGSHHAERQELFAGEPSAPRMQSPWRARQVAVPPDARALSTLSRIDYEDAFLVEVDSAGDRTAEQWIRAILDDAPIEVRQALWCGWLALGLKVGSPRSARRVLGWEVRRSAPEFVVLGAGSWIGMPGELCLQRRPQALLLATFVRQGNPLARALWARVARRHRQVVPRVLERAARGARAMEHAG
jgi:hypothetical protein